MFYSIDNEESLFHLYKRWNESVTHCAEKGVYKIIIGNKIDLEDNRLVTEEEGI